MAPPPKTLYDTFKPVLDGYKTYLTNAVTVGGKVLWFIFDKIWDGGAIADEFIIPEKPPDTPPPNPIFKDAPLPPKHVIKPPPKTIYPDPTAPPPVIGDPPVVKMPDPPDHEYIKPPVDTTGSFDSTFTVTLAEGLKDRKFGCLLTRPYMEVDMEFCVYGETEDHDLSWFWTDLLDRMATFVTNIITDYISGKAKTACQWAAITLPLPVIGKAFLLIGCEFIDEVIQWYTARLFNLDNYISTGLVTSGHIKYKYCELPLEEKEETEDFELFCFSEVGIPLNAYDDLEGRKTNEVQILWKCTDTKVKGIRTITIPFTKDITTFEATVDDLKGILPQTLKLGTRAVDVTLRLPPVDGWKQKFVTTMWLHRDDIKTDQEMRVFIDDQFMKWVDFFNNEPNVTPPNVEEKDAKLRSRSVGTDDYQFNQGDYYPYKVIIMGWINGNDPTNLNPDPNECTNWVKKAQWFIYTKDPTKQSNP